MNSGSMLINNYLKEKTLLKISNNIASSEPEDNALADAKSSLTLEKSSPSPNSGHIAFLTFWIRLFTLQEERKNTLVSSTKEISSSEDSNSNVIQETADSTSSTS